MLCIYTGYELVWSHLAFAVTTLHITEIRGSIICILKEGQSAYIPTSHQRLNGLSWNFQDGWDVVQGKSETFFGMFHLRSFSNFSGNVCLSETIADKRGWIDFHEIFRVRYHTRNILEHVGMLRLTRWIQDPCLSATLQKMGQRIVMAFLWYTGHNTTKQLHRLIYNWLGSFTLLKLGTAAFVNSPTKNE